MEEFFNAVLSLCGLIFIVIFIGALLWLSDERDDTPDYRAAEGNVAGFDDHGIDL